MPQLPGDESTSVEQRQFRTSVAVLSAAEACVQCAGPLEVSESVSTGCIGVAAEMTTTRGRAAPLPVLVPGGRAGQHCGDPGKPEPGVGPEGGVDDVVLVVPHWSTRLVTCTDRLSFLDDAIERDAVLDNRPVVAHPATSVGARSARAGVAG